MSPPVLSADEWESLCDGCGKCCDIGGGVACPRLKDKRCTVYEDRLKLEPCIKVTPENTKDLHKMGILPDSCAYVRHLDGLPPEPKEYTLLPFVMATHEKQREYVLKREKYFGERYGQTG